MYRVLDHWREHRYVPVLSPLLLAELSEVLRYPRLRRRHRWSDREVMQLIEGLAAATVLVVGDVTDRIVDEDPDDDAVLACAFDGRADYVVTGDQHLLALGAVKGIRIVRPRQFLDVLPST